LIAIAKKAMVVRIESKSHIISCLTSRLYPAV
jgi:hypothetical protein